MTKDKKFLNGHRNRTTSTIEMNRRPYSVGGARVRSTSNSEGPTADKAMIGMTLCLLFTVGQQSAPSYLPVLDAFVVALQFLLQLRDAQRTLLVLLLEHSFDPLQLLLVCIRR